MKSNVGCVVQQAARADHEKGRPSRRDRTQKDRDFSECLNLFRPRVAAFLSPLRGLVVAHLVPHGLRRGLYSFAASRLRSGGANVQRYRENLVLTHTL